MQYVTGHWIIESLLLTKISIPLFLVQEDDFAAGPHSVSFTVGSPLPVQSCTNISTVDDDNVEGDQEIIVSIVSISLPNTVSTLSPTQQSAIFLDNDGMCNCNPHRLYRGCYFP